MRRAGRFLASAGDVVRTGAKRLTFSRTSRGAVAGADVLAGHPAGSIGVRIFSWTRPDADVFCFAESYLLCPTGATQVFPICGATSRIVPSAAVTRIERQYLPEHLFCVAGVLSLLSQVENRDGPSSRLARHRRFSSGM